jgi:hypothetical protein
MIFRTGSMIVVAGWVVLTAAAGCGTARSSPPSKTYGREGHAIGLSREQRQGDLQEQAKAEKNRDAEVRRQEIAAATRAAVAEARPVETPATKPLAGQIKHVVVMWLKNPGDAAVRKQLIDAKSSLAKIPGVIEVSAGEVVKSDRPVVDSSYDVAYVVTFNNEQSLRAYGPHPIHQKLVEDVIKPNVAKFTVYDFVMP